MARVRHIISLLALTLLSLWGAVAHSAADIQTLVGDQYNLKDAADNPVGPGEGSFGHVLTHVVVGCGAAELQGGDCGAGAVAAGISAIIAGEVKDSGATLEEAQEWADEVTLISGIGAALTGADSEAVQIAAGVGTSAFENNYLTHAQIEEVEGLYDQLYGLGCGTPGLNAEQCSQALNRLSELEQISTAQTLALINNCTSNLNGGACQTAISDARAYVEFRSDQGFLFFDGSGFGRFDVDLGVFYHPGLDGKGGGSLDELIIASVDAEGGLLDGGSVGDFLSSVDDSIESELVLWGNDRLAVQGELLSEFEGLNDVNDPLVESTCYTAAEGGAYTCMTNRRMELQSELVGYGLMDFFVPYTPLGLGAEVALLGTGTILKIGGKTVVRVGDELIEVVDDGAGGYRLADDVATNTGPLTPRINISDDLTQTVNNDGFVQYVYRDANAGHGIEVTLRNGKLEVDIAATGDSSTLGSGTDMFNSSIIRLQNDGHSIDAIQGVWIPGTGSDNFAQFNQNLASGMSRTDAAQNTWTGQIAASHGFTEVLETTRPGSAVIDFEFVRPQ